MRPVHILNAVDSHTAGEPTRVILSGIPHLSGDSMMERLDYFRKHYDYLRTAVILEPRGHGNMYAAVMIPPCAREAEIGQFFLSPSGYPTMCGHGTIGMVTALVETGAIPVSSPFRKVVIDTPVGIVEATAEIRDHRVLGVTVRNIPCFLLREGVRIDVEGIGQVQLDISFAGNFFYAQVDLRQFSPPFDLGDLGHLIKTGLRIRERVNQLIVPQHPENPAIRGISAVDFFGPPIHPDADARDLHVYGTGQIDRSPCGTGVCAEMANLFAKGKLRLDEEYVQEGLTGEIFQGRIVAQTKVGDHLAIIPEVKGRAFITGMNQLIIDEDDPLKYGIKI